MKVIFDDCTIDTDRFQVERRGQTVSLTPQTAKILDILIRNRDRVVTKDELAAEVWDDRIITDATLSTALKKTRQIVGDTGRAQNIIRTIHGRGFQFVAAVDPQPGPASPDLGVDRATAQSGSKALGSCKRLAAKPADLLPDSTSDRRTELARDESTRH